jgi:hypothetical protein
MGGPLLEGRQAPRALLETALAVMRMCEGELLAARGFADADANGVIDRLRTAAELSAEEVTRTAFGGAPAPRRAVITHAVAANERSSVTLQVPEWQASEREAANALDAEFRAPRTVAEIAQADAPEERAGRGGFKRGQRQFKPLFKDYPYETKE